MADQGTLPRLRQHPDERFRASQHLIDLDAAAGRLAGETASPRGHRQETLYRHGNLTVALFLFEAGAGLAEHKADGVVTIQVLQGHIKINAEGQAHDLPAGRMLVLAPGVKHDVLAEQPSRMLLTISKESAR
ncbi:MAG TPA: cupin domain-containing protein [Tepidisphaeraceae bacterium]|nr:cupin domain-containing protein [Tepidisphaeraceae bacterium]